MNEAIVLLSFLIPIFILLFVFTIACLRIFIFLFFRR